MPCIRPEFFILCFLDISGHYPMLGFRKKLISTSGISEPLEIACKSITQFSQTIFHCSNTTLRSLHSFCLKLSKKWLASTVPQIASSAMLSLTTKIGLQFNFKSGKIMLEDPRNIG